MKILSSYLVLSVNGGDRISYTYDEVDDSTGDLQRTNEKSNFFVVDEGLREHINAIRDYIRENKL